MSRVDIFPFFISCLPMGYKILLSLCFFLSASHVCHAQTRVVKECKQKSFPRSVPAGDYSGIAHIRDNRYAVVSDKSLNDGFFVFTIDIDSVTGEISDVRQEAFMGDSLRGGDCEGIVYRPSSRSFFICREADASILEYDEKGCLTGRKLAIPGIYKTGMGNYGFESLAYDASAGLFWTMNESTLACDGKRAMPSDSVRNVLRLQSFGDDLLPKQQYAYRTDVPEAKSTPAQYATGVSEIVALDDGRLLVLEREFFVPKMKLGAFVKCKLYEIRLDDDCAMPLDAPVTAETKFLPKRLICSFETKLTLFGRSLANYEGMCLGPKLADGSQVLVLVSDSQGQYRGVLKDWFKTIVIAP